MNTKNINNTIYTNNDTTIILYIYIYTNNTIIL